MKKQTEFIISLIVLGLLIVFGFWAYKKYNPQIESVLPGVTPNSTCKPRPACLDETPRCLIPETEDMCPRK